MKTTSLRVGLDGAELSSSGVAVVISAGCYVAFGHRYLALGVVGDAIGLAVLVVPLLTQGERGRHEAAVCLIGIGLVHVFRPDWPLRFAAGFWWTCFAAALALYLGLRWSVLADLRARRRQRRSDGVG